MTRTLTVLAVAAALGLAPDPGHAQQSDSDQILAKASIINALSVAGVRDLDFGTVLGGTTVTVTPTEAAAGKFEIDAQPGAEVRLEATQIPSELTRVGGAETIPLTLTALVNDVDDPATAASTPPENAAIIVFPVSGQQFYWVGGTITTANDQTVGDYQATIELTASYTGS